MPSFLEVTSGFIAIPVESFADVWLSTIVSSFSVWPYIFLPAPLPFKISYPATRGNLLSIATFISSEEILSSAVPSKSTASPVDKVISSITLSSFSMVAVVVALL